MKGVKCILSQKLFIILALLFIPLFALFISNDSYADVVNYEINPSQLSNSIITYFKDGTWYNEIRSQNVNLPYTIATPGQYTTYIYGYYFNYYLPNNISWANYTTINFTLDIRGQGNWWYVQPSYQNPDINSLYNFNPIIGYSDGTFDSGTCNPSFYSDGSMQVHHAIYDCYVVTTKTPQFIAFRVGNMQATVNDNQFATIGSTSGSGNPLIFGGLRLIINSSTNKTDFYLEQQINQNQTVINQNQQIIDQDNQDRQDLQNASDDGQEAAEQAGQAIENASASLLTIIGNFVDIIIHPPNSDCTIDADMGHMDLGTIDLCQLSPPPAFGTIATILIIGFTIPFAYSLIMTFLSLLRGATED